MKRILIEFCGLNTGLGDVIAVMPYVEKFRQYHNCILYFQTRQHIVPKLYKKTYPEINFLMRDERVEFDVEIVIEHPSAPVSLQKILAEQLGFINPEYLRPRVDSFKKERPIKNKYVVIGVHSTAQAKYWNHPSGKKGQEFSPNWDDLCGMIRKAGYTPVIVEPYETFGIKPFMNGLPKKANKKIGMSLEDTMNHIEHAEFFIGLSSGLTWLAHAAGKPVCMISNVTEDWNEFDLSITDYKRLTNKSVCHGCWNRIGNGEFVFDYDDWYWCPKHAGTSRQFECHTSITPERVFEEIKEWIV